MTTEFGIDLAGVSDSDELFSTVTGPALVRQTAIHRLTTDDILGGEGVIVGWGVDVRRFLGRPAEEVAAFQPTLVEALLRDPRIESAEVELEVIEDAAGNTADIQLAVDCETAEGPFSFVRLVSELSTLGVSA